MKYYKISEDQLKNFIESEEVLTALQSGGVDNWIWYRESLSAYIKDYIGDNTDIPPNELTIADIAEHSLVYFEPIEE